MSTRNETRQKYTHLFQNATPSEFSALTRHLALYDLFFLLVFVLGRKDLNKDWLFERCREVQEAPDGHLDLWFRDAGKSSIITFGKTVQDILRNPEITVGIFSCTRPIAKAFLRQIKREFEGNSKLKTLFPEILYTNPQKSSPKWSDDEGIVVKRKSNPKESTVEAWGMVDGMPTSKHFQLMVYDDVVTKESVNTPEMVLKTNAAWELSRNLATVGGRTRYIGTRYNYADTYALIMERKAAIPRIYPATDTGKPDGIPLLWTREVLQEKIREMGVATAAAQLFQDPRTDSLSGFNIEDLRYWSPEQYNRLNIYILVDPASTKTKRSDYTVFVVMGLGEDENYYVIDIIRDRLSLTERANVLFKIHRQFRPLAVGYEQYGLQADIQHYEDRMARENYRFQIIPLGGKVKKEERISGLQPLTEAHRLYLPDHCIHQDYQGTQVDVTRSAVEEFRLSPFSPHDDILDAASRILDEFCYGPPKAHNPVWETPRDYGFKF